MATPYELSEIAKHSTFRQRVKYYMQKNAVAVLAEPSSTPGYQKRTNYADDVIDGSASVVQSTITILRDVYSCRLGSGGGLVASSI